MAAISTLADPEAGTLDDLVDADRYPINRAPAATGLAADVARRLRADGAVTLPGFLRPAALAAIRSDLDAAVPHVAIRRHQASVYHRDALEAELAADDPRCVRQTWCAGHVTRDMIPVYSPAHRLYVSPWFKQFIAACVGRERVFEYADPIAGLVATVLPPGGEYPWHYDTNEFVVTIMIREPESGGRFEYAQDLRRPGDEVMGDQARHVLVLSYADRPGVIGPLDRTRSVYGRVTEAHLVAAEAAATGPDGLVL